MYSTNSNGHRPCFVVPRVMALALAAVAVFAATGCRADPDRRSATNQTTPIATASEDLIRVLRAAASKVTENTFSVRVKFDHPPESMTTIRPWSTRATIDPAGSRAKLEIELAMSVGSFRVDVIVVGENSWFKLEGQSRFPKTWVSSDRMRKPILRAQGIDPQYGGLAALKIVETATKAASAGERATTGEMDLTRLTVLPEAIQKRLGGKLRSVPFTATVDRQGRLTTLSVWLSRVEPGQSDLEYWYSKFGQPVDIRPPSASEVTTETDAIEEALGGR